MATGAAYRGYSGVLRSIPDILKGILPKGTLERWSVFNCAEVAACAAALRAGEKFEDLVFKTVNVQTMKEFPPCRNCERWLPNLPRKEW